jgi:tripartite-type tricarboxylate transporter receptor subunit TctC
MKQNSCRFALSLMLLFAGVASVRPAQAQDYYKSKTITLYAGMPPGGGIDSEMRMVAHYFGRFIPGEPAIIPRNMQGAGGMILGNYLSSVARPDGLTLGMPGRSGFVLAPIVGAADVKYDLRKFSWIGSSASSNYILWMGKQSNIRTVEELKGANRQIIIAGSGSTTANSIIPEVLARYEGFPIKVVRGYPGMNDAILAVERGEADGVLTQPASLRRDLVSSGAVVPIVQVFSVEPDLPLLDRYITKGRTRGLLELLNAPQHLGLALVAPPGMPDGIVKILRQSYLAMVASKDYQDEAIKRSFPGLSRIRRTPIGSDE